MITGKEAIEKLAECERMYGARSAEQGKHVQLEALFELIKDGMCVQARDTDTDETCYITVRDAMGQMKAGD